MIVYEHCRRDQSQIQRKPEKATLRVIYAGSGVWSSKRPAVRTSITRRRARKANAYVSNLRNARTLRRQKSVIQDEQKTFALRNRIDVEEAPTIRGERFLISPGQARRVSLRPRACR